MNAGIFTLWQRELLANILGISVDSVDEDQDFDALGIDSLTAVSLTDEVQKFLKRPIEPSLYLEHRTIRDATKYLIGDTAH